MASYIGLWKRETIQIGNSTPYENTTVYWLQAATYFADIRIPLTQPALPPEQNLLELEPAQLLRYAEITSFAGMIEATDTWIRWHRQIDFQPNPHSIDQGQVHYEGDNLIEIGEFEADGMTQTYREVWVPQPGDREAFLVLELEQEINLSTQKATHPKALWVTVGEHFTRIYDNRFYPSDFVAPAPEQLTPPELKRLMQFQTDYGKTNQPLPWQILLSNNPSRIGTSLQSRRNYQAQWQSNHLVETWQTAEGEQIEQHWAIREAAGNDLTSLFIT
jgi:hypothetical protein